MILRAAVTFVLALAAAAAAIAPLALQQPFGSQTPAGMWIAHAARQWSGVITAVIAVAVILLAWSTVRGARWRARVPLLVSVALVLGAAWLARQNLFEWMFNPLLDTRFVRIADATFVAPADLVLTVTRDGDAAAYPIRQLAYHHIVNDRIGGTPAVVTY